MSAPTLTPAAFAQKWSGSTTTEKAASQEHFIDLCRMVGEPTPHEADPTGEQYAFERRGEKAGGGDGFADVWKRGFFAWEYKGHKKDLKAAHRERPRQHRDPDQLHRPQPDGLRDVAGRPAVDVTRVCWPVTSRTGQVTRRAPPSPRAGPRRPVP